MRISLSPRNPPCAPRWPPTSTAKPKGRPTADLKETTGDCSQIKRRLLPGRKVMTNLDSILKSRDITLPTKVHLVKAMVFPVVVCGCESRKLRAEELMLLNCGVADDS